MRIVVRPDFDGIVCTVLLKEALGIDEPVQWVEPNAMQSGQVKIRKGDIIANLAYREQCTLWFDHHVSNRPNMPFEGAFELAPSAAGLIFSFFNNFDYAKNPGGVGDSVKKFQRDFTELVAATDKIDSASVTLDEVLHPEKYPYILLSTTIVSHRNTDEPYWDHLVDLLRNYDIRRVLEDPEVKKRCREALEADKIYISILKKHTVLNKHISITDFRSFDTMPVGNRFLVFTLFPEGIVNLKIRYHDEERETVIVSVSNNIFNRRCSVNTGLLCARFGGGGHFGAGSCSFDAGKTDEYLPEIIDILLKNEKHSLLN